MMRIVRAEWKKTWRRGMLIGGIGLIVAFSLFAVSIRFLNASRATQDVTPQQRGPPRFPISTLETPQGPITAFAGFAANFIALVSLVLFAQNVGSEYGWGTLRVTLSREPRRWRVLFGKIIAMTLFVGLAVLIAILVEIGAATMYAAIRSIDTSTWWTAEGFAEMAGAFLRVWFTATVWGTLGATLAFAFRSAAPAIGVGIGYTFVVENLLALWWTDGDKWLPGQLLRAFNGNETTRVSLLVSGLLLAGYFVVFLATSGILFQRRDVSA
jgi:ABC-type transport system involved in multi-copper enzyme maturation permease subunit